MSYRSDWSNAKTAMERVGVDTKLFGEGLGPELDAYEAADRRYQSASGANPRAVDQARAERKAAATRADAALKQYGTNIQYLEKRATDPRQRAAITSAGDVLMRIGLALKKAL